MRTLLFFLYGSVGREYHLELSYSVLSAQQFLRQDPADIRVVFASDRRNMRPDLPAEQLLIEDQMIHEWQLGGTFCHAAKQHVLAYALDLFDAPIILMDADTVFQAHPKYLFDRVGPGRALLNEREHSLVDSSAWRQWEALIQDSGGAVAGYEIAPSTFMYNTGVVGLDPSDAHYMVDAIATMREIVRLCDMFTAEQLATSIVLTQHTEVATCEDLIEHYWGGPRAYYHYQIAKLFPEVMVGEPIKGVEGALPRLQKMPPIKRVNSLLARLKRFQLGGDKEYQFAYVAYRSALSCRHNDPALANVWATMALNILLWGAKNRLPKAETAFKDFRPEKLKAQQWMAPQLQQRWQEYWKLRV
jgi:hypothetical protein